jgi:hypothetical protein
VRDLSQTEPLPDLILVNIGVPFYERMKFFAQLRKESRFLGRGAGVVDCREDHHGAD